MARQPVSVLVEPLRKLLRRHATGHVRNMLYKLHPADVARLMDYLSDEHTEEVFRLMLEETPSRVAELVSELPPEASVRLFERIPDEQAAEIIAELDSDDAAHLIAAMPEEVAAQVMDLLEERDSAPIEGLLRYEEETAGRIMSPGVFALEEHVSVREAIARLRSSASEQLEMVFYLYVVDDRGHLVGVCSLRDLLLASPDTPLGDVMNPRVAAVSTSTDQEEVARLVARYNYLALPVVDHSHKLVGIITVDDVIDVIQEEETEDILRMAGVGDDEEEVLNAPLWRNAMRRFPWLLVAFVGGLVASRSVNNHQPLLQEIGALAGFIPIILGMGGNAGTQSATVMVRGLATGRITRGQILRVTFREVRLALVMGMLFGGLLCGVAYLNPFGLIPAAGVSGAAASMATVALIVGLGITTTMTLASTIGTCMPVVLSRMGADPAIATGPFVTTAIDVLGVLAYFSIATSLLGAMPV